MARAVTTCVHCGFCLAACPTYKVMGEEMDSPRGRIVLMKQALEGELTLEDARPYVDRCLGCLACETACPSGVRYRELVVPFRARLEANARPAHERLVAPVAAVGARVARPLPGSASRGAAGATRGATPLREAARHAGPATCRIARGQSSSGTCPRHRPAPRPCRASDRLRAACAPAVD